MAATARWASCAYVLLVSCSLRQRIPTQPIHVLRPNENACRTTSKLGFSDRWPGTNEPVITLLKLKRGLAGWPTDRTNEPPATNTIVLLQSGKTPHKRPPHGPRELELFKPSARWCRFFHCGVRWPAVCVCVRSYESQSCSLTHSLPTASSCWHRRKKFVPRQQQRRAGRTNIPGSIRV